MNRSIATRSMLLAAALLCGCSSVTKISAPDPGTTLLIKGNNYQLPVTQQMKGTSFGNYEFKASEPGADPFYGILPLRFKGGHLAVDIIFFAPAALFNLREVFPYYEIDVHQGVIRYKEKAGDTWVEYKPKAVESAHARDFYEGGGSQASSAH